MFKAMAVKSLLVKSGIHASPSAIAALAWWIVPILAVLGAVIYVVWVSKFQEGYENETHRSVGKFSAFQASFRRDERGPK